MIHHIFTFRNNLLKNNESSYYTFLLIVGYDKFRFVGESKS